MRYRGGDDRDLQSTLHLCRRHRNDPESNCSWPAHLHFASPHICLGGDMPRSRVVGPTSGVHISLVIQCPRHRYS
jgi:hypothetical protein